MIKSPFSVVACILAVGGNFFIAWLFWSAQESPQRIGTLVMQGGYFVLVAELLAIYAGGITSGKQVEAERSFTGQKLAASPQKRRIALLAILILASLLAGRLAHHMGLAAFFIASLLTKYFGHRAVRMHPLTVITIISFFASFSMFVIVQSLSEAVLRWWGMAYFATLAAAILILFTKELQKTAASKKLYGV